MESTENSEQVVRRDYTLHRTIIRDSFFSYLSENKRYPSNNELARRTGLSEKTIRNHLKNFDLAEITEPSKLFAENVLMSLIKRIQRTGDPSAVKLYLFLVFGIDERGNLAYKKKEEDYLSERTENETSDKLYIETLRLMGYSEEVVQEYAAKNNIKYYSHDEGKSE